MQRLKHLVYRHPYYFFILLGCLFFLGQHTLFKDWQQPDHRGRTMLYLAAEQGDLERVDYLLTKVDHPDQRDDCRWTPLMRAAQNGHLGVVQVLLDAGADVHAQDKAGYSVLMVSAISHHPAIIQTLVEQGARIDQQDPGFGYSALMLAAKEGQLENVRLLLEAGADLALRDRSGMTALDWAVENSYGEVVHLLSQ